MDELDDRLTPVEYSKLRWRCRRGLLENDLFIERYLDKYGSAMTVREARAMYALMDLADNDLLDLMLRRKEPTAPLDTPDVLSLLERMRTPRSS
ncbi:succinate dehydrogenase assembly factor 2 [Brachymonas sp. G13]|uniref:FAD assembly factor SdhE n=1 Tax=Brachymonas TaxID=28219 RepID=UPI0016B7FD47|nr:succinate dehydrogenase assembly factor 2 [Brachymonas sp. J145]MEE1653850.1 succinate dehydrogenase assembly factor 2 [Brachymonas sp. J145]NLX16564.1 succinate dehydrogenase assembly factor 2 [Ramlibacter sp.]